MSDKKKSSKQQVENIDLNDAQKEGSENHEDTPKNEESENIKQELEECRDKLLRIAAEYENFRKRSEKEKEAIYSDALSSTILGILPLMDSLEAAESLASNQSEEYLKGITLLKSQFNKALKNLNVESFGEVGDQFDPNIHNAIAYTEQQSDNSNCITKVFQKGYKSKTRIIRHAMVEVTN